MASDDTIRAERREDARRWLSRYGFYMQMNAPLRIKTESGKEYFLTPLRAHDCVVDVRNLWNTRAERTCEMPMVFEDDEGNELESSAAYFRNYRCSSCGEIMEHYKHEYWFFCPNCGAKVVS